jgi:hypothetical protein
MTMPRQGKAYCPMRIVRQPNWRYCVPDNWLRKSVRKWLRRDWHGLSVCR